MTFRERSWRVKNESHRSMRLQEDNVLFPLFVPNLVVTCDKINRR